MEVIDVQELHYITPISNLPSILKRGILSHRLAERFKHDSIAMPEIQDIRARIRVPGGTPLHEYANLYFNARNAMMFLRKGHHRESCVIRIRPDVLYLSGVVITDRNAAIGYRRWGAFPEALGRISKDRIFAEWWSRHADLLERERHKGEMCAEVLVPNVIHPEHIAGVYVSCAAAATRVRDMAPRLHVSVNGYMFFFTSIGRPS